MTGPPACRLAPADQLPVEGNGLPVNDQSLRTVSAAASSAAGAAFAASATAGARTMRKPLATASSEAAISGGPAGPRPQDATELTAKAGTDSMTAAVTTPPSSLRTRRTGRGP